jgi:hypothetical protein
MDPDRYRSFGLLTEQFDNGFGDRLIIEEVDLCFVVSQDHDTHSPRMRLDLERRW